MLPSVILTPSDSGVTAGGCHDDGWVKMTSGRRGDTRTAGDAERGRVAPWSVITGEI